MQSFVERGVNGRNEPLYEMSGALGTLCAASFLVGLISVTLIERLIDKKVGEDADGE